MKKQMARLVLAVMIIFLSLNVRAEGAPEMKLGWDPPTFKTLNSDCNLQGEAITPADLSRISYEVAYRVTGTTNWTKITTATNALTIINLAWSTSYDVLVGAKWGSSGAVSCLTDILVVTTSPEPTPGKCSNLRQR